jgi:hypothetical protein
MAARKNEESKKGLVITLVIFVILSLGLAVSTYFGFAGQQVLEDKYNKEKKQADSNKASRDWERYQNLLLKIYVGHPLSKEDQDAFTALNAQYDWGKGTLGKDETNRKDFDDLARKLAADDGLGWDGKQPKTTYKAKVDELTAEVSKLNNLLAKANEDVKAGQEKLAANQKSHEEAGKEWEKKLTEVQKKLGEELIKTRWTEYAAALNNIEKMQQEVDQIKKAMEKGSDDSKKATAKREKQIKDLTTALEKAREQIKPPNVQDYDKPKGKIVQVEGGQSVVYINLGSADNVKPQLTFSVYGVGPDGKTEPERKGSVEVANIVEPHLARARVTELTDPNREPILRGDLLFNPTWSPNLKQHVAIAGLIDLTGDGTNDTRELVRGLEKQGIVVDAYLDLKDLKAKGPGMSAKTTFLILGDQPQFDEASAINPGDVRTDRKIEALKQLGAMQADATRLGITIVPYRKFLAVIGYPTTRVLKAKPGTYGYLDSPLLGSGMKAKETPKKEGEEDKEKPKKAAPKEEKEK